MSSGADAVIPGVGLDVRILAHANKETGVPYYVRRLAEQLNQIMPNHVTLFSDSPIQDLSTVVLKALVPRLPWQQTALPIGVMRAKVSVFHGPAYAIPLWGKFYKVVTIHDAGFIKHPQWLDPKVHQYLKQMVPLSLRVADRVIVPTQCVLEDLSLHYPQSASKIEVIPLGSRFAVSGLDKTNLSLTPARPYILHVGTHEPRKNLVNLLRAYRIVTENDHFPYDLVLVGMNGWKTTDLASEIEMLGLENHVKAIGYVADEDLVLWYALASGYVQPAYSEGFGISTLDAFCAGLPIAATRTGWIRDHGDPGVCWIDDPNDVEALANSLWRLDDCDVPTRNTACWSWENTMSLHQRAYLSAK